MNLLKRNGGSADTVRKSAALGRIRRAERIQYVVCLIIGAFAGAILASPLVDGTLRGVHGAGGPLVVFATVTGLYGTLFALFMVVLAARIPWLDRAAGLPKVMYWHRQLSVWALSFIFIHALAATVGEAVALKVGVAKAFSYLARDFSIVLATFAIVLMLLVAIVSVPKVRSNIPREWWWLLHLSLYAALVLAFSHELLLGPAFVTHPLEREAWIIAWLVALVLIVGFRVAKPIAVSLALRLSVASVKELSDGRYVEITVCSRLNRRIDFLGGQYLQWRFLSRKRWWQAHPFTVLPTESPDSIRLVARRVGDFTDSLTKLEPGTKVFIEGPYGSFTVAKLKRKPLIVAGGAGVTAMRALMADLPSGTHAVAVIRASNRGDVVLYDEIRQIASSKGIELRELLGSRNDVNLAQVFESVTDARDWQLFVSGPPEFVTLVSAMALQRGFRGNQIETDAYSI